MEKDVSKDHQILGWTEPHIIYTQGQLLVERVGKVQMLASGEIAVHDYLCLCAWVV